MSARLVLSLLCSVVTVAATARAQAVVPPQSRCAEEFLGEVPQPSLAQLQEWTRRYYPDLAAKAVAPARLVVGFLLDDQCRVLRHSVGMRPQEVSPEVVEVLFPGATQPGAPTGIGDGVPPDDQKPWNRRTRLYVAWQVQVSAARKAQMKRERVRLQSLNGPNGA
jgi:hypothetical protein